MISRDGGETLTRSDAFLLPHIAGGNRDPKVFYHPESAAYIMVLYLDGSEFAISAPLTCSTGRKPAV